MFNTSLLQRGQRSVTVNYRVAYNGLQQTVVLRRKILQTTSSLWLDGTNNWIHAVMPIFDQHLANAFQNFVGSESVILFLCYTICNSYEQIISYNYITNFSIKGNYLIPVIVQTICWKFLVRLYFLFSKKWLRTAHVFPYLQNSTGSGVLSHSFPFISFEPFWTHFLLFWTQIKKLGFFLFLVGLPKKLRQLWHQIIKFVASIFPCNHRWLEKNNSIPVLTTEIFCWLSFNWQQYGNALI